MVAEVGILILKISTNASCTFLFIKEAATKNWSVMAAPWFRAFPSHMVLGKYFYKSQLPHVSSENIYIFYILEGSYFLSALQPMPALFLENLSFLPSNLHDCPENCQDGEIWVSLSTHQSTHIPVLGFSFLPLLSLGGSSFLCSILGYL